MTEAQQTEMDPRDPLRRLSVENRWGAHTQDRRLMTEPALCWGSEPGSTPHFATSRLWGTGQAVSPPQASVSQCHPAAGSVTKEVLPHLPASASVKWLCDWRPPFPRFK